MRSDNADFRTLPWVALFLASCPASVSEKSESLVFNHTGYREVPKLLSVVIILCIESPKLYVRKECVDMGLAWFFLPPSSTLLSAVESDFFWRCMFRFFTRILWKSYVTCNSMNRISANIFLWLNLLRLFWCLLVHYFIKLFYFKEPFLMWLLCSWTLSIILSLSKNRPVFFSKHCVSETGLYRLGPTE
jgi:hypothetical protein